MTNKRAANAHEETTCNPRWVTSLRKTANALRDELARLERISTVDLSEAASELGRAPETSESHVMTLETAFLTTVDTLANVRCGQASLASDDRERLVRMRDELLDELSELRKLLGKVSSGNREYHKLAKCCGIETSSKSKVFGIAGSDMLLQIMGLLYPCLAACVATEIELRPRLSEDTWDNLRVYWAQQLRSKYTWKEISALLYLDEHDAGKRDAGERLMRRVQRSDRTQQEIELKEQVEQGFRKQEELVQELFERERHFERTIDDVISTLNEHNFGGYPLGYLYLWWSGAGRKGPLADEEEVLLPTIPRELTEYVDEFRRFYQASCLGLAEFAAQRVKLRERITIERALYSAHSSICDALS